MKTYDDLVKCDGTKKIIEKKYESIIGGRQHLSASDILWLTNLSYFRTLHIGNKYAQRTISTYLDYIGNHNVISSQSVYYTMKAELEAGFKVSGEAGIFPLDYSQDGFNRVYRLLCANEKIMNLKIIKTVSEGGMTAAAYTDCDGDFYVIFRGTDGPIAWVDNAEAMGKEDSVLQDKANRFYNECLEMVGDCKKIIVAGHSKGGNIAKYLTVVNDEIDACVSTDGQGFSVEFLSQKADKINKNKHKIIEVNAEYDFVNCMGNQIQYDSKQVYFIRTKSFERLSKYHYPDIIFGDDGELLDFTYEKCTISTYITNITVELVKIINNHDQDKYYGSIGQMLAELMTEEIGYRRMSMIDHVLGFILRHLSLIPVPSNS